jgi:hypothetical protein
LFATRLLIHRSPTNQHCTAFADVGVPSSEVVRAIENIIYEDSGALRSMDEDW